MLFRMWCERLIQISEHGRLGICTTMWHHMTRATRQPTTTVTDKTTAIDRELTRSFTDHSEWNANRLARAAKPLACDASLDPSSTRFATRIRTHNWCTHTRAHLTIQIQYIWGWFNSNINHNIVCKKNVLRRILLVDLRALFFFFVLWTDR